MKLSALFLSVLIVFNNIQLAVFAAAVEPQQESKEDVLRKQRKGSAKTLN